MNPTTERFLSRDPEDGNPADPMTLQKYLYANANSVNFIDPSGGATTADYGLIVQLGALTLATGAAVVNYEQHASQTEGALRELGASISCAYSELATLSSSWVSVGLAGDADAGTVSRSGPCTFMAQSPPNKKPPKRSPNAQPPTNAPQQPPAPPPGCGIRMMPGPSPAYPDYYPNGYWILYKIMANGGQQPLDPRTMRPSPNPCDTHVPFPEE